MGFTLFEAGLALFTGSNVRCWKHTPLGGCLDPVPSLPKERTLHCCNVGRGEVVLLSDPLKFSKDVRGSEAMG